MKDTNKERATVKALMHICANKAAELCNNGATEKDMHVEMAEFIPVAAGTLRMYDPNFSPASLVAYVGFDTRWELRFDFAGVRYDVWENWFVDGSAYSDAIGYVHYGWIIEDVRIGGASKIGEAHSFGTLPGGAPLCKADGTVFTVIPGTCPKLLCCAGCYARATINYSPDAKVDYTINTLILRESPWVVGDAIVADMRTYWAPYFRANESGDYPTVEAIEAHYYAARMGDKTVYSYTHRHKLAAEFYELHPEALNDSRFVVILSVDMWQDPNEIYNPFNLPTFKIYAPGEPVPDDVTMCPNFDEYEPGHKRAKNKHAITCDRCGICPLAKIGDRIGVLFHI